MKDCIKSTIPVFYCRRVLSLYLLLHLSFLPFIISAQPFQNTDPQYINGYKRTISGETLSYFSMYRKYVKEALLTRTTDGRKAIEWETDVIPENISGEYAYFTWIAAHSSGTSSGARNFDLYINGEYALTFTTYAKQYPPVWRFVNKDSAMLAFELKTRDGANDSHGMAYLRVPLSKYKKGTSLKLKVVGQNQQSNDWYMTFKYAFTEKIECNALPFLLRDKMHQLLNVTVLHFGQTTNLKLNIDHDIHKEFIVKNGFNSFEIPVPAVKETKKMSVKAEIGDILAFNEKVQVNPVTYREVDLIHHSHTDIGYSHIQEEVIRIHNNNIRQALKLIEKTKNYPDGSRFVWNIESAWVVENFLHEATNEEKTKLMNALQNGQIVVSGFYANVLTGLCMPEEINWISDYAFKLGKENRFPVRTAMISDVPGLSWSVVASLAKKGIRYFSNGMNYVQGMEGNGDRIGHSLNQLGDKPFWWKSPLGKDSILMFCGGKGYSSWHGTAPGAVFEIGAEKIGSYLNELDEKKYPYAMVHWRYNIVADNGPVDSTICDFVRQWNEKYASPKLVLANLQDFFERFEKAYGKTIPGMSGDFTPYWEDGAYSTAKEEAANREAAQKIINLEKYAQQKGIKDNENLFYLAKKYVLLFHEHTWGAYNSISEPDVPFVIHQWEYKKSFLDSALMYTQQLENRILKNNGKNRITVINTLPFSRSQYVEVKPPASFTGNYIKDQKGNKIGVQHVSNGHIGFIAKDVPANSEATYQLVNENNNLPAGNFPVSVSYDKVSGAVNSIQVNGKEWVDNSKFSSLPQAIYVSGLNPAQFDTPVFINAAWIENGPVIKTLQLRYKLAGTNEVIYNISLFSGLNELKISVTIDKKAVRSKESVHIALPFNISNATTTIGSEEGIFSPEKNQLPGANKDYYSVQHWLNVTGDKSNVTITCPQGALFEIGEMINEQKTANGYKKWKEKGSSSSLIFLYAMNNYWHTNYKADQDGKITFDIYLGFANNAFDRNIAKQFGEKYAKKLMSITPMQ